MSKYATSDDLDLIENTATRLPVCIVLDCSASMDAILDDLTGVEPTRQEFVDGQMWNIYEGDYNTYMKQAIDGINRLFKIIYNDDRTRLSCEISIVAFADKPVVLSDFHTINENEVFEDPGRGENTNLGAAVKEALNLLDARKQKFKQTGTDYYQPWLFIFTDGDPTDKEVTVEAQKMCRELEKARKLVPYVLTVGEGIDTEFLKGFTPNRVLSVQDEKIAEFFEWLGRSASIVANIDDPETKNVQMDSGFDEWLKINM